MPREGCTERITSLAMYVILATAFVRESASFARVVHGWAFFAPASAGLEIDPMLAQMKCRTEAQVTTPKTKERKKRRVWPVDASQTNPKISFTPPAY